MNTVEKQKISFKLNNENIIGDLYLPKNNTLKLPATVVAGPMTSVKEQVTGVYAEELARLGFAALAIDHRHYGESDGEPRQYEYFKHKIEDLSAAVDYLAQRDEVDENQLGLTGICLGSGYASWTAIQNAKVKWLGLIVGYYRDVAEMKFNDSTSFQEKVNQGIEARKLYERNKEVICIPAVALTGDAAMTKPSLFEYYAKRANVSNYTNSFAVMSREYFLPFDVQSAADKITIPIKMVHSKNALSPNWAEKFYEKIVSRKEILWLDGENQDDFYDNSKLITLACSFISKINHK